MTSAHLPDPRDHSAPASVPGDHPAHGVRPPDAERPTYEGRPLDHPDEPVVDQGLRFDIGTLLSRRRSLALLGGSAAALGLAACGAAGTEGSTSSSASDGGTSGGEIPDETAGPYPGDGSNGPDVLTESGVVRQDLRSSFGTGSATATGVPMTLTLWLTDLSQDNAPYAASPCTSGTAPPTGSTRCTPRPCRRRTTCAACRSRARTAR
ncbi:hypothetical protein ACT3TZ_02980 [Brachybacterium sp. AOP25-B2-12]|uniref:hypothetical protein n=1 Tax=Brachybacterium sp. AOP25-B2-12 TaxID=3457710 RepID=UPI0040342527